jgi:hypothetical protein
VIVGGHRQPRANTLGIFPGQDKHGIYQAACIEFADDLGYTHGFVTYWWSQIAMARELVCKQSRDVAEDGALRDVKAALDKRGATQPD